MEAAGFTDVKVLGVLGNTEMCSLISQGTIAAAGLMQEFISHVAYRKKNKITF